MTLVRWRPRQDWFPATGLLSLKDEMERAFDHAFGGRVAEREFEFTPAVDVVEHEDKFIVKADLPGMKKEDLDITFVEGRLTLKGEKKQETEIKEENYHRIERYSGSFRRTIELPSSVDHEKVSASYRDGVLEITIPKKEEVKPKQIKVETK